jgi:hypothetical protein
LLLYYYLDLIFLESYGFASIRSGTTTNLQHHRKMIESYSDDKPFPSGLFHRIWKDKPLHAVIAYDTVGQKIFVITAYWPDEEHFEEDFKTRRKQ